MLFVATLPRSSNRIIGALSEASRRALWSSMERIDTKTGQVLGRTGESISHFYFVESGMISLMKSMQNGAAVEISTTGPEGIAPLGAIFDLDRAVFESVVLIPGEVLRIRREALRKRLASDRELFHVMRGYAGVALNQLAQSAACNILHSVEERCCRWLLTAHDAARDRTFSLTHEFLGAMLGVRRASVSGCGANSAAGRGNSLLPRADDDHGPGRLGTNGLRMLCGYHTRVRGVLSAGWV